MNICHPKMKFTFEKKFNFLYIRVVKEKNVFATSGYRKPTFSGVYTHLYSHMLLNYMFSLVSKISFFKFAICSDISKFHLEICKMKDIFVTLKYLLTKFVKALIKKLLILKRITQTADKKRVTIVLPIWTFS